MHEPRCPPRPVRRRRSQLGWPTEHRMAAPTGDRSERRGSLSRFPCSEIVGAGHSSRGVPREQLRPEESLPPRQSVQHREDAIGQGVGQRDVVGGELVPGGGDAEVGLGFGGAASSDAEKVVSVPAAPAIALGDVRRDRRSGIDQLASELRILAPQLRDGRGAPGQLTSAEIEELRSSFVTGVRSARISSSDTSSASNRRLEGEEGCWLAFVMAPYRERCVPAPSRWRGSLAPSA